MQFGRGIRGHLVVVAGLVFHPDALKWRSPFQSKPQQIEGNMIKWAVIFAIIALVLGVLGFGGLAGAAWGIAKILFWLAVIIAVALFILGLTIYRKVT